MATEKEILIIEIRADGARVVKRNLNDIGKAADGATDAATQLKTILGGLITSRVIRDVLMLSDAYANLLNRLRVVTGSTYELNRAMDGVFQITKDTRTALEGNVDMYARVALNTKKMGFVMKDVLRFARQLNHAVILSGVTAREAQWGMVQFSQALAAGALRGDELRAVMEQLPVVTDVITDHMGITRGELRKLAFEGRVTPKVIIAAFNAAEANLAERFAKRIPTLDQGLTVLRSSFIRFIGEQDQVWKGTSTLAQVLLWASDNMDTLGRFAQIAGTVLGGILLTNTIKLIAQWKILSLSILRTHGWLILFAAATTAIVVYADKIKLAGNSTATLADAVRGLGPELLSAGTAAKEMWNELADTAGLDALTVKAEITLESLLLNIGRIADRFAGIMQGIVATIINGVQVIGAHLMRIIQLIGAFFKAVWQKFKIDLMVMGNAITQTARAADAALSGRLKQAKSLLDTAALTLKTGTASSIGDIYEQEAAKIDATFTSTGKTSGEAFWEAFHGAGDASEQAMKRVIDRAKATAAARSAGKLTASTDEGALTPQQVELMKQVNGGIEKTVASMADLKVLFDSGRISVDQYNRAMTEMRIKMLSTSTDVASGFKRGFMELGLEISNFSDIAQKTVTNAFNGMEDALVSFVTTGKVDFKSMVDSMLSDLTRLLARQLMMKAITGAVAAFAPGGGGLMGIAGSALRAIGGADKAAPGPVSSVPSAAISGAQGVGSIGGMDLMGRAAGGPMSPGVPYRLNEHSGGPQEVVILGQQGRAVNNREASQMGQQTPIEVKVVNVWSEADVIRIMDSNKGQQVIVNRSPGKGAAKA